MPLQITREEAKKLGMRPIGKKHHVRIAIETMEKGEIIYITRAEFSWKKKTPLLFTNKISMTSEKKFAVTESNNKLGWIVERIA